MGAKLGPQVYQIRHLSPSVRAYIDDLFVGTLLSKASRGKGKLFDSSALHEEAVTEHDELVRKLFGYLAHHHLQVKKQKFHLFCPRVECFGHILHQGRRSPAPEKVAAVRDWNYAMIRTPKQMKKFLGVCNWCSIYTPQYAFPAAPLMDSLKGKYEGVPEGGKWKVPKDRSFIEWTQIIGAEFCQIY